MQLTTLTTMLFTAVVIASPIALPAKAAAANIEVSIVPPRSTTDPSQTADKVTESRP
jgi:hypothetical protein